MIPWALIGIVAGALVAIAFFFEALEPGFLRYVWRSTVWSPRKDKP